MIGLAKYVSEHRKAIEHDLLVQTGHEINDIGRTLSWGALDSFLRHIGPDSATARELDPEASAWGTLAKTNMILADIWDVLAHINANLIGVGTHKAAKTPKPYPRPGQKQSGEEKRIGSEGLPPNQLREWFENKRKEKCQK